MEPTEHFGIYFGYIRRLFQSWVSSFNDAVELFYRWTETAISEHIPTVTMKTRYPPWFDADVKRALREKERAHFLKKHSPNDMRAEQFSASRTRFKNIVLYKYRRYYWIQNKRPTELAGGL